MHTLVVVASAVPLVRHIVGQFNKADGGQFGDEKGRNEGV